LNGLDVLGFGMNERRGVEESVNDRKTLESAAGICSSIVDISGIKIKQRSEWAQVDQERLKSAMVFIQIFQWPGLTVTFPRKRSLAIALVDMTVSGERRWGS
jgi:hypothetical protein